MSAEITARTLEFSAFDVPPIKYDFIHCDVVGLRVSYHREEVTSVTALTIDPESKLLVPIAYRVDLQEFWEPWIRELVEEHRTVTEPEASESRLAEVERLVEEARDENNYTIDTDLLLDALGLES